MKMKNLIWLFIITILINGCAQIKSFDGKIIGKVKLSDNPPTGNGNVLVYTNSISTTTATDGTFSLIGTAIGKDIIYVSFEKQGYKYETVEAKLGVDTSYGYVCNLGEIVLEKIVTQVFDDSNDGNANGWTGDNKATYRVENGEYSIESPNDGLQHWTSHSFYPGGNFSYEAEVKDISGNKGSAYGIGVFDTSNAKTCLFICKNGYYEVTYYDNSWHDISNWTLSSVIDTVGGDWNKLKIIKEGTYLEIYINDSQMGSFSSSSIGEVNTIGLYVQDNLHIHFDNIKADPTVRKL